MVTKRAGSPGFLINEDGGRGCWLSLRDKWAFIVRHHPEVKLNLGRPRGDLCPQPRPLP